MNAKTISDLIIVEDNIIPNIIFVMKNDDNDNPVIFKFVLVSSLPNEIKQAINNHLNK